MNGGEHGRLLQARNHAFIDRPRCCDAQRMAIETSFAKEVTWSQDCNHRFLALLGNDGVRDLSLRENNLILPIFGYRFPSPTLARNSLGSNEALTFFLTKAPLFLLARAALSPDEGRARRGGYSDSPAEKKIWLVRAVRERSRKFGEGTPGGILPSPKHRKSPKPPTRSPIFPPF